MVMPLFECQVCKLLTEFDMKAKLHNKEDPHHFFKRIGEHTYLDGKIQRMIKDVERSNTQ